MYFLYLLYDFRNDILFKFFTDEVDPLHNDQIADVPEDIMQQMKDLGLFGLQVPEELEGIGLNNTQYARMTEVSFLLYNL